MKNTQSLLAFAGMVATATAAASNSSVGGYVLINGQYGLAKMASLGKQHPLPISRLYVGFFNPTLSYVPGSRTLNNTGLNLTAGAPGANGDYGFSALASSIAAIRKGGVEVLLSLGGWDFTCFPYLYARYSVGGYGTNTPNYYKIQENCGGDISNAGPSNEYCYVCEPTYANESLGDFAIFPEPASSASWQAAVAYVTQNSGDPSNPPIWDPTMIPGASWTDPKTGISTIVPGLKSYAALQRDPYQDFVHLALDLGVDGVDIDYEEVWYADYNKLGPAGGPWTNPQTVYKLAAIYKDVQLAIDAFAPHLFMTTAASAAGAWAGNWWGGNLKGVSLQLAQWYPTIASRILWNVMTYDLSDNEQYYECPDPGVCPLNQQVNFYMNTYTQAGGGLGNSGVGYEIGTPAYPDPEHDPTHDLPLIQSELSLILSNTQPSYSHAFFWEIFKQPPSSGTGEVTSTQLAQQLCTSVFGAGTPRCKGTFPMPPLALYSSTMETGNEKVEVETVSATASSSSASSSFNSHLIGAAAILDYLHSRGEATSITTPQPIRCIYIDWRDVNWVAPNSTLVQIVDSGFNVIIMAFYLSTTGAVDMLQAWSSLDATTRAATIAYAHSKGAVILLSAGGATDIPYIHTNGTNFGAEAGRFAMQMSLDGVDIDAENIAPEFTYPPFTGLQMVDWLVDASIAIKQVMGSKSIVSHAPQAPYFGPLGGTGWTGPTGGYTAVWKNATANGMNAITFFNMQFYNQGTCYLNFSTLFIESVPSSTKTAQEEQEGDPCYFPGTAVQEIASYGVPLAAMVIGKPLLENDAGSGYVDPSELHAFFQEAANSPVDWNTGVMAWSWETTQAPTWIQTVWPQQKEGKKQQQMNE